MQAVSSGDVKQDPKAPKSLEPRVSVFIGEGVEGLYLFTGPLGCLCSESMKGGFKFKGLDRSAVLRLEHLHGHALASRQRPLPTPERKGQIPALASFRQRNTRSP